MNIFKNRPLCMMLCIMLGGFALFSLPNRTVALVCFCSLSVVTLLLLLLARHHVPRLTVALLCLCLSFFLSHLYFDLWFPADRRIEGDTAMTGTVIDISYAKNYGGCFIVQTDAIADVPLSSYRLLLVTDCKTSDLTLGEKIRFHGEILPLDGREELSPYENSSFSLGCSGGAVIHAYQTVSVRETHPLRLIDRLRTRIGRYIDRTVGEGAPLLRALFLGDTSAMSDGEIQDFRRIGISHLLAVSGMHLSVLSAFLTRLFRRLRLRVGLRSLLLVLFTLSYMTLTGFSSSVLRAGIMLLLFLLLSAYPGSSDPLTDLSVAFFLICLFKPYAVFDLSLLLSVFATLGILAVPKVAAPTFRKRPFLYLLLALLLPLMISFFATGATLPFTVFSFGEISLLSLLSTPVFGVLIEGFIILGIPALLLGSLFSFNLPLSAMARLIASLAARLSDLHGILCSADFSLPKILTALFALGFFFFLSLHVKHKRTAVTLLSLLFVSVFVSSALLSVHAVREEHAVYLAKEDGEALLLTADGGVTLLVSADCDPYLLTEDLKARHVTEIDELILPAYSSDLEKLLTRIAARIKLRGVILPMPRNNDERFLLKRAEDALADASVSFTTLPPSRLHAVAEGVSLSLRYQSEDGKDALLLLQTGKNGIAYLTSGVPLSDKEEIAAALSLAHCVIFGKSGGSGQEDTCVTLSMPQASAVLICRKDLSLSEEERKALLSRGSLIYLYPTSLTLY